MKFISAEIYMKSRHIYIRMKIQNIGKSPVETAEFVTFTVRAKPKESEFFVIAQFSDSSAISLPPDGTETIDAYGQPVTSSDEDWIWSFITDRTEFVVNASLSWRDALKNHHSFNLELEADVTGGVDRLEHRSEPLHLLRSSYRNHGYKPEE